MGTIITDNAINVAIHEVVQLRGADYVYESPSGDPLNCVYADSNGKPSCLVGQVIAKLDPEMFADIVQYEKDSYTEGWDSSFDEVAEALDLGISDRSVRALRHAQMEQDQKRTWGEALEAFEKRFGALF